MRQREILVGISINTKFRPLFLLDVCVGLWLPQLDSWITISIWWYGKDCHPWLRIYLYQTLILCFVSDAGMLTCSLV